MTKNNITPIDNLGAWLTNAKQTLNIKSAIICVEHENGEFQATYSSDINLGQLCEMTAFVNYYAYRMALEDE